MDIEEIIVKEKEGQRLTEAERKFLSSWLRERPENLISYSNIIVDTSYSSNEIADLSKELKTKLNPIKSRPQNNSLFYLKIAASITVVALIGLFWTSDFFLSQTKPTLTQDLHRIERISRPGTKLTTYLPDGSMVKLNSGSKLSYSSEFNSTTRVVHLTGEAFFDVKKEERPFIIKTENIQVKVLGTSFVVKSVQSEDESLVGVITGLVQVKDQQASDSMYVSPTEVSHFTKKGGLEKIENGNDESLYGWIDNKLVFKESSFPEVIHQIEMWFGIEVKLDFEVSGQYDVYSATYDNPTLKEVLSTFSHVNKITYEINGNEVRMNK